MIPKEAIQYTDSSDGIMKQTGISNGMRGHPNRVECRVKWKERRETA